VISLLDGLWTLYDTILHLHHLSMIELPTISEPETPSHRLFPESQKCLLFGILSLKLIVLSHTGVKDGYNKYWSSGRLNVHLSHQSS